MNKFTRNKNLAYLCAVFFVNSFFLFFCNQEKAFSYNDDREKRYNVVFIIIDALRADHLSCYGYNRKTTPNIDLFAKDSVLFTQAISQSTVTRTSVPSIVTSLYPSVHKVFCPDDYLEDAFNTLPDILKKKGYSTVAFVGPQFESFAGFLNRFDSHILFKQRKHVKSAFISKILTQKAVDWLRKEQTQPFFMYLHYFDVHAPYINDEPFKSLFWKEEVTQLMSFFSRNFYQHKNYSPTRKGLVPDQNMVAYFISQYDGKINFIDHQVRNVIGELEKTGLIDNTIVIITSDHGEEFGEHRDEFTKHKVFFHGASLYEGAVHVPLIMKVPQKTFEKPVIPDLVRHIDIMPTILDVLNIRKNSLMQGVSLLLLMEGKKMSDLSAFFEAQIVLQLPSRTLTLTGIRTDKWKFIKRSNSLKEMGSYELYDLKNDPKETSNIAVNNPLLVQSFIKQLNRYSEYSKLRKKILGNTMENRQIILNESKKERLKSLGYIQ